MIIFRALAVLTMMIHFVTVFPAGAADKPLANGSVMDAMGEFLRGMNALSDGKKALPGGDPLQDKLRTKYEIPDRIQILAPRGGGEIVAMVFNSERLPVIEGKWIEIASDKYKYLQSHHNLKVVYCLHEKEPLDLGDVVVAFLYDGAGAMVIYFNDKHGTVGSARIQNGNSIIFSGSQYLIRPLAQER